MHRPRPKHDSIRPDLTDNRATPGNPHTFPVRFPVGRPFFHNVPTNRAQPNATQAIPQPTFPGDAELLRGYARAQDDAAFAELVRRHVDLVFSAALRQLGGNRSLAEEVTQSVFTELARKASRLQQHPALSGWLYTTTRFMARTALRAEDRRVRRERTAHAMQDTPDRPTPAAHDSDFEPELSWSRIVGTLDEAMHELNDADRVALVLRHFENRPFGEIGQRLGLSPNTARMRVDRAVHKLRQRLARRGITSTSAALASVLGGNAIQAAPLGLSSVVASAATTVAAASLPVLSLSPLVPLMTFKSKLLVTGLVASMIVTPLALQQRSLRQLRHDLAAAQTDLREMTQAEATARQAAELAAAENANLKTSQIELLRLRGEIGPLRDQVRALARPAANASLQTAAKPGATPKPEPAKAATEEPADVGSTTAEHAATSLIWAVSQGRVDRLSELLELPPGVSEEDKPRHYSFFADQLGKVFSGKDFNGWKLELAGTTNEDRVRLDFGYRDLASGQDDTFRFHLHRHDNGWKVLVEGQVPENF